MSKVSSQIGKRIMPRGGDTFSRSVVRKLSMEPLERRCPMDAAGLAAGFGEFAIIGNERVIAPVAAPAITCYAEEFSRLPQSMPAHRDEHEAFPDPGPTDSGGDLQGPRPPEETIVLHPETPSDLTGNANQEPPSGSADPTPPVAPDPEAPLAGQPLRDIGHVPWRPDGVHFSAPQPPEGSIGLDSQLEAHGDGPVAKSAGPYGSGVAQRGARSLGAPAARWQVGQRSEMSLSHTRYFDSSDLDSAPRDNLHSETSSLLSFAHQVLPEEIGIAIGSTGTSETHHHAAAHRGGRAPIHSRSMFGETGKESTARVQPRIDANEADLAIVAFVSTRNGRVQVPMTDELLAAAERPTPLPLDQSAQNPRVAVTDQNEADLQPNAWQHTAELLADLSHWAVVGLLLSNHISSSFTHSRQRLAHRLRRIIRRAK